MGNCFGKSSNQGFFSESKKKLVFKVKMESNDKHVLFSFSGPSADVERRFFHMIQNVKGIASYEVDRDFSHQNRGGTLYRISIDKNSDETLIQMFWFLRKSWKGYNGDKLLLNLNPTNGIREHLSKSMRMAFYKRFEPLPAYVSPKSNRPRSKDHA